MAIFVPLWREHRVIGQMLDHNLAKIQYTNYDVFVGVYPNDTLTRLAVTEAAAGHSQVHVCVCGNDGPTSKGDCLNWIYREMEAYEARNRVRFEVIMTHDAEDMVHPLSLRMINWFSADYQMVQIPVLPLRTGILEITHGLYCDEFAEYQQKDIPVRQRLGGFVPSNGVGTGFGRVALERLAETRGGMIFDPACLTEDYENGYRLHALGCPQIFVPLRFGQADFLATREFFPRRFRSAVRQRSRWVAGIVLQGWQFHGWDVARPQLYWLWRDRKGLVGNLLSPLANLLMIYLLVSWFVHPNGEPWHLGSLLPAWLWWVGRVTLGISVVQIAVRAHCCARIYGWFLALWVPVRLFWGNGINGLATVAAIRQFTVARFHRRQLAWRKTDHAYPTGAGILVGSPRPDEVSLSATRVLPAAVVRRWRVMPYRIAVGQLHVATVEMPSEELARDLSAISGLELRFRLIGEAEWDAMARRYLPKEK